jgi:hypothetical protein
MAKKTPARKVAAKKTPKKVAAKKAGVRKAPVKAVEKTPLRKPATSSPSRPAAPVRKPQAAPRREAARPGPVSPEVAIAHFQQLLRAKQDRVRQGPNYPPANAFSGRHDTLADDHRDEEDPHAPPAAGSPEPDAVYGAHTHARGNQEMRKK